MALPDLLQAMREDAEVELARIERESGRAEKEILSAARDRAREIEDEARASAKARGRREAASTLARARLDARRHVRERREQAFAGLLDALGARLAAARGDDAYPGMLEQLLDEALEVLPDAKLLRADPRDEQPARELAKRFELELRLELETIGGLELVGEGRLVRNTFEERLRNSEPTLRLRFTELVAEVGRVKRQASA